MLLSQKSKSTKMYELPIRNGCVSAKLLPSECLQVSDSCFSETINIHMQKKVQNAPSVSTIASICTGYILDL